MRHIKRMKHGLDLAGIVLKNRALTTDEKVRYVQFGLGESERK